MEDLITVRVCSRPEGQDEATAHRGAKSPLNEPDHDACGTCTRSQKCSGCGRNLDCCQHGRLTPLAASPEPAVSKPGGSAPPDQRALARVRWDAECALVARFLPSFAPYARAGNVGFEGVLRGPQSGTIYQVRVEAPARTYPACEPAVFVTPPPERNHTNVDGSISIYMRWIPTSSTFASVILQVTFYINEVDRPPVQDAA